MQITANGNYDWQKRQVGSARRLIVGEGLGNLRLCANQFITVK